MIRREFFRHAMTTRKPTIEQIGAELVEASKSQTEHSLPLSTKLFPYIYVASRRMSLRAISRWLEDNHGCSLTAASISRALSSPELHLERFADSLVGPVRYVAKAYGFEPLQLLFGELAKNGPSELQMLADHTHKNPEGEHDIARWSEMQDLAATWEPIPHEVKLMLQPYLEEHLQYEADFEADSSDEDAF